MIFLNPEEILNQIDLEENMIGADFGCGSGGFTFPLAKKLKEGFVYALDIQELPLSALKGRAEMEKITNIDFIHADIEKKTNIPESSVDIITIINVLFQVEDKKSVLIEAKRLLKNNGKLLIIDWNNKNNNLSNQKISLDEIKKILKEIDLKIEKEFEAGAYHYGILLKKT